jgi:Ca-activated chloride channel family protein
MYKFFLLLIFIFIIIIFSSRSYADSLYSRMQQGDSLYNEEKFDEALNLFVDAQIEAPENIKLKYNIASSHYKMKNYEEAVKGYLDVASAAQDAKVEETALYNIGNAMYRQGKLQEAVEYYNKAIELDPEDKDAQHNLEFVREEIKKKINDSKKTEQQQKQQEQKEQNQEGQCDNGQKGEKQENDKQEGEKNDKQDQSSGQDDEKQDETDAQKAEAKEADKEKGEGTEEGSAGQDVQMTKEEAEQWLNSLQENRDKYKKQEKQKKGRSMTRPGNDW